MVEYCKQLNEIRFQTALRELLAPLGFAEEAFFRRIVDVENEELTERRFVVSFEGSDESGASHPLAVHDARRMRRAVSAKEFCFVSTTFHPGIEAGIVL